jgi:hypothetical protein
VRPQRTADVLGRDLVWPPARTILGGNSCPAHHRAGQRDELVVVPRDQAYADKLLVKCVFSRIAQTRPSLAGNSYVEMADWPKVPRRHPINVGSGWPTTRTFKRHGRRSPSRSNSPRRERRSISRLAWIDTSRWRARLRQHRSNGYSHVIYYPPSIILTDAGYVAYPATKAQK